MKNSLKSLQIPYYIILIIQGKCGIFAKLCSDSGFSSLISKYGSYRSLFPLTLDQSIRPCPYLHICSRKICWCVGQLVVQRGKCDSAPVHEHGQGRKNEDNSNDQDLVSRPAHFPDDLSDIAAQFFMGHFCSHQYDYGDITLEPYLLTRSSFIVTRLRGSGHCISMVSPCHQGMLPPNWKVCRLGKIL
jgi:hypothetical protein